MNIETTIKDKGYYLIAEIGQNHQGNLLIAKKMVDMLKHIPGVSAIKTAKRDIESSLTTIQKNAPYENSNSFGSTYYDHRKALELSNESFIELKNYVEQSGLDFISSFTDTVSLQFLIDINTKILKIASQRAIDIPLLLAAAQSKKPIILSTGMCDISNVDYAVSFFRDNASLHV